MTYDQFNQWVDLNKPLDANREDFICFMAMLGVVFMQSASNNTGMPIEECINFAFAEHRNQLQ